MNDALPYDRFADIYGHWVSSAAAVTDANGAYYARHFAATKGIAVELGIGDGRISIAAAKRGKRMLGVDNSRNMLALCDANARAAGVRERLTLQRADFRDFEVDAPAELVAIPFHSIGHMLTRDAQLACMRHVRSRLAPGGRFLFDHFVADEAYARAKDGVRELRDEWTAPSAAHEDAAPDTVRLWAVTHYDFAAQVLAIHATSERSDASGAVVSVDARPALHLSWIDPEDARALLAEAGFEVVSCCGDFAGTPFDATSRAQVWTARR